MANILSRKTFIRRVTIPSNQAITYYDLMVLAPATANTPVWGTNADGSIPSLDAAWGDGATIIPQSETLYVGYSQDVTDTNSATTYIGVPTTAAQAFSLQDYWPGPVDTSNVWFWSRDAQECDLIFQGRQ